jgi:exodeoxyribonuclease V gamma subunit
MLRLHRAERADSLASALAEQLAVPPADPFQPEVVCVPTRGMERWLAQQLSTRLGTRRNGDGICANVDFPSPARLLDDAVAVACGVEPSNDPWRPERSTWPLLEIVEESIDEPWLALLARHLGRGTDPLDAVRRPRRLATVRHLATLFDRYAAARPEMLRGWAEGEDVDDAGAPLAPPLAWQAELYRRLRARIGGLDLPERLDRAVEQLRADPAVADLPDRLSVFGLTRLSPARRRILEALAEARDVHLYLLHPSPSLWSELATTVGDPPPRTRRQADAQTPRGTNRLLASWGQDARDHEL